MAGEEETTDVESSEKISMIHPKNLINALSRLMGSDVDEAKANPRGEILYSLAGGYILGNSIGTNNTLKGGKRFNLGPVYFW